MGSPSIALPTVAKPIRAKKDIAEIGMRDNPTTKHSSGAGWMGGPPDGGANRAAGGAPAWLAPPQGRERRCGLPLQGQVAAP